MGQMKWIYQMVQDGTIVVFKQLYNNAVKYKLNSFIFESRSVDVMLAQAIIKVAAKAEKEYEDHLDEEAARQADAYYEWTQTIYE